MNVAIDAVRKIMDENTGQVLKKIDKDVSDMIKDNALEGLDRPPSYRREGQIGIDGSTYRAFRGYTVKARPSDIMKNFFLENKENITNELSRAKDQKEFNSVHEKWIDQLCVVWHDSFNTIEGYDSVPEKPRLAKCFNLFIKYCFETVEKSPELKTNIYNFGHIALDKKVLQKMRELGLLEGEIRVNAGTRPICAPFSTILKILKALAIDVKEIPPTGAHTFRFCAAI
jgi:hypothetical protein